MSVVSEKIKRGEVFGGPEHDAAGGEAITTDATCHLQKICVKEGREGGKVRAYVRN